MRLSARYPPDELLQLRRVLGIVGEIDVDTRPEIDVRARLALVVMLAHNGDILVLLLIVPEQLGRNNLRLGADAALAAVRLRHIGPVTDHGQIESTDEWKRLLIRAVPKGQWEAGTSLGLKRYRVFVSIVLPQALRVIFPALSNQIIIILLESAVVSQIAVQDLTYEADVLQARTFRAFETYLVVMLIYLGLATLMRRVMLAGATRWVFGGAA